MTAVGYGLPMILVAFGFAWLGVQGYAIGWLGAGLLVVVGIKGLYLAARGGVAITDQCVEVRRWFKNDRVDRTSIRSVVERRDRAGEPVGWLATTDNEETMLRGATARHRHGPLSKERCSYCEADHQNLVEIARDLGIPLVDGGSRPASPRFGSGAG